MMLTPGRLWLNLYETDNHEFPCRESECAQQNAHPIGVRCMKCNTPLYVHEKIMQDNFGNWLYAMPCPKCISEQNVQRICRLAQEK